MNKFFIYCRKSSEQEDRQILSLDSQEKELTQLAKEQGLEVIQIYKESGSAHVIGRKYFNEMLNRIENGEANGLVVWDESRIARNSLDGGKVIYMMDLKQIVEIHKPGKTYRNTPDDKSWLSMVFMMSKKESDDKGINVKRGLKTKAEKGWLPSGAKPGYTNDKYAERGNKTIQSDPIRFHLIKKCWELMLNGSYTPPQILELLNNKWGYRTPQRKSFGGKPMCRSEIYRIFSDSFYYGRFEFPLGSGNWYKGSHEAMITEEEFNRVQIMLGRKHNPRPQKREFPFTGLMTCGECGATITAEERWRVVCTNCKVKFSSINRNECPKCKTKIEAMKNPKIYHFIHYHCTKRKDPKCSQGTILSKDLESQIDKVLTKVNISEDFKNWAIKYLNELNDSEKESRNATIESLQNAFNNCVKRLDNLLQFKISPQNTDSSLLSNEEFKAKKTSILSEKNELEEKLKNTGKRIENWIETVETTFDFAVHAKYKFANGSPMEKRQILITIGSNLTLKDKKISMDLEKPYCFIESVVKQVPETSAMFEPEKEGYTKAQMEYLWAQNPLVLPRVDSDHEPSP